MLLVKNGNLITMADKEDREVKDLLIDNGVIADVGPNLSCPEDTEIIDATGKTVMPGMIDAHTHLGIFEEGSMTEGDDTNEMTGPITPELRALDAVNPYDEGIKDARLNGITTIVTGPGSGNVIGGQSLAMKTWGTVIDDMVVREPSGLKAAFGENPKRVYSEQKKSPSTRMATAALFRKAFYEAREYMEQAKNLEGENKEDSKDQAESQQRDFRKDILVKALKKEIPIRAHAHRADDILTAIRVAREFDLDLSIEHCTEGHKLAEILKRYDIPAIIGPNISARIKIELKEASFETPRILHEAGVKFAIMTDHPVIPIYTLPICAAMAVRAGLPYYEALKAITISAAEIIGINDRVGSLETGKDADLIICDGDILSLESKVEHVFISGKKITE